MTESESYVRGQMVTIRGPYNEDPLIVELQPHGRVADVGPAGYWVVLGSTWPPGRQFGPFPADRLRSGWAPL